jgi:hypothetical protein
MQRWVLLLFLEDDDCQIIDDVAVDAAFINNISSELRVISNMSIRGGPHDNFTLRNRRGDVLESFHSMEEAHEWITNECPNSRGLYISRS